MSKKKPDYTKFMRKPAPLQMSPKSDDRIMVPPSWQDDVPWAEIILELDDKATMREKPAVAPEKVKPEIASAGEPVPPRADVPRPEAVPAADIAIPRDYYALPMDRDDIPYAEILDEAERIPVPLMEPPPLAILIAPILFVMIALL